MIIPVQAFETSKFSDLTSKMHQLRAEVFSDRLGWDVQVIRGEERDSFDDANPLYLMSVGDNGELRGCLRLLPTTGPNMLRDVFDVLMDDPNDVIESPLIWESTRFCVSQAALADRSQNRLNYVTGELLAGIVEVGKKAGLTAVLSVYDARMRRVLRTAGCPADEIGTPKRIGGVTTYAGLFSIDDDMLERIRSAAGIVGSVLTDKNSLAA